MTALDVKLSLLGCATALVLAAFPNHADACGGTFCDAGSGMSVQQTGENILFWIDRSGSEPYTEAHIQIQYRGNPLLFAWLVPVRQVPEVMVGSQALFDILDFDTRSSFKVGWRHDESCGPDHDYTLAVDCAASSSPDDDNHGFTSGSAGDGDGGGSGEVPEILDRGFAGAFEYVTLTGDNVEAITNWLDEAGYEQDPDAPPILEEYLEEGYVFVAFKLRGGYGINAIHPLALRYPGVEPCIPLRLTRIAAVEDMAVRAYFLGHERVVPQNWPHVVLNFLKIDWIEAKVNWWSSYMAAVVQAIDEAGGRAFITTYAGTDDILKESFLPHDLDSAPFVDIDPVDVVAQLEAQGLMKCNHSYYYCEYRHPLILQLLQRYLPTPQNDLAFYACMECLKDKIDLVAWSAQPGFAADYEEQVSGPANHALAMLDEASYLTKLYTIISPHEMIDDPTFQENGSLGDVDKAHPATEVGRCGIVPAFVELDDGRDVLLIDDVDYPSFTEMPSAERIERIPMVGPPQIEVDNSSVIDAMLEEHNQQNISGPRPGLGCAIGGLRPEALLTMLALFGIAWVHRRPRRGNE